jgi:Do/DeqQ family serine protease
MHKTWLIFAQAVTVAVAALFVVATLKPEWLGRRTALLPAPTVIQAPAAAPAAAGSAPSPALAGSVAPPAVSSYAAAARAAGPAVVSITAQKPALRNPHLDDPAYRFFFGDRDTLGQPQVGLGSGVIVSPEGYLLTNQHVVAGSSEIDVLLADGRQARAKLIGGDAETDIAVLKIDLTPLPVVLIGDPSKLQVGDPVLAIGNPFSVGQTVTSGIVSALGRNRLGLAAFENFIQTDAAINPGNSGGALVDGNGALVGINTAIFSQSGGSQGIGFAVPVDLAREVMEALVKDGRVVRGWIGVVPRELTPEVAESLGLSVREGVLIRGVLQDGPAGAAGMRPGDVVLRIGATSVKNEAELLKAVAALKPQTSVKLAIQRGDKRLDVDVTVGSRPPPRER